MRLDDLLVGIDVQDMREIYPDMEVTAITADSRKIVPGSVFVAISGTGADGHDYIPQALAAGATVVIQSRPVAPDTVGSIIRVRETREVYALLSAKLADYPSRRLRVIGVTGTNGKTSTTLIARHLLNFAGYRAAALGTLGLLRHDSTEYEQRGLTTPDASDLQRIIRDLADHGTTHLIMEVSSHALDQHRVSGVEFTGAVFTNISQDHFDYHGTLDAYIDAKSSLFTQHLVRSGGYAVINTDDEAGLDIARRFNGISATFGSSPACNLVVFNTENRVEGLRWELVLKNGVWPSTRDEKINHGKFTSPLVGRYNIYNCVGATGVALLEGLSLAQVIDGLAAFAHVPGRLQAVPNDQGRFVFVDYAHTPDALENVLAALDEIRRPNVRIITVIGCGGDRDAGKRPLMGRAAQSASDVTVITSDNPRTEDPDKIIDDIYTGIDPRGKPTERVPDRRQAIRRALTIAQRGDIVLVAGKGHEDYQILGERTIHFSDIEEVEAYYNAANELPLMK
ncbi:UDP-N-acetylmuramoyl-L-alanyl-D-glutamate--2,6-diaminopimelate ligase [bacterium]|nr:UDP-N-acetylmuramoyl-L-alanyl-D-glutamate--2,6-diaminopimelate ligase [bacterium]